MRTPSDCARRERPRRAHPSARFALSTDTACEAVDSDGADVCGLARGHEGVHYSFDPIGTFWVRRRCLACRKATTARLCVCSTCLRAGVDPAWAARERNQRQDEAPLILPDTE